ncbi:uncharacterized protein FTOL_03450 [Fusarium torulosum]|uniref:Uncharacterized protein n=1 Tax=Fusarium torulosum TaxID=33205 RepID=A0AAE8M404_9HYPO|nr:uncharacterized protein FTOL_03450 [Fusarium torulosum]
MEQALSTGHATEPKDLTDESEVKAQVKSEVKTEIQPRSDTAGPKASAKRKLPTRSSRNSELWPSSGTVKDSKVSSMRPSNPSPLNDDGNDPTFDLEKEEENEPQDDNYSEDETSTERAKRFKREQHRKQCAARKAIETPVHRAKRLARDKNVHP